MGPTKVKAGASKGNNKRSQKPSASGNSSKIKKKTPSKVPTKAPAQQKTKSASSHAASNKKKKRVYTEKELGIPELNGIVPAGVTKPPNMKKGKNFVDDGDGMNTILAMVMAEKEGNIESKMMKARQLEEVREARKVEMEKRADSRKAGLEERKKGIKEDGKKKRHSASEAGEFQGFGDDQEKKPSKPFKKRKRVSFG